MNPCKKFCVFLLAAFILLFSTGYVSLEYNQVISSQSIALSKKGSVNQPLTSQNLSSAKMPLAYMTPLNCKELIQIDSIKGVHGPNILTEHAMKPLMALTDDKSLFLWDHESEHLVRINPFEETAQKISTPKGQPSQFAIVSGSKEAFVCYANSHSIYRLDLANNTYTEVFELNEIPDYIALSPNTAEFFVFHNESKKLNAINLETFEIQTISSFKDVPEGFILSADGKLLYVLENQLTVFTIIDLSSKKQQSYALKFPSTFSYKQKPIVAGLNSRENVIYFVEEGSKEIYKLHLSDRTISTAIDMPEPAFNACFCSESTLLAAFEVIQTGNTAKLDASATNSLKEGAIDYYWDFGDGYLSYSEEPFMEHIYETAGEYVATLVAKQDFARDHFHANFERKISIATSLPATKTETPIAKAPTIPTTSVVVSSANPATFQQNLTFTATVSAAVGTPTGSFTFMDGATVLGTVPLTGLSAAYSLSTLTIGTHPVTAVYSGDATFLGSTSPQLDQIVNPAPTTTNLTSSPNGSVFGQSVLMTATVTTSNSSPIPPGGTVTFKDGATTLGSSPLVSGVATFSTTGLSVATHALTAVYSGDTNFSTSTSNTVSQVVDKGNTSTALTSSVNPTIFGNATLLTATISVTSGAGTPTGTVTFRNGTTTIGTGTISGGVATFSISSLGVGTNALSAVYNGDGNFNTSISNTVSQVVNKGTTTSVVVSSVPTTTYGAASTLTATVSVATGVGTPTGFFTFMDGSTVLGSVNLTGLSAALSVSDLSVGTHSIAAIYSGDTNFLTSTSPSITQTVNKATPIITLVPSPSSSSYSDVVTFTSTVTAPTSLGLPGGAITFFDGVTSIGTATLTPSGANTSTASIQINTLSGGTHPITAVYSGDGNFVTVTSSPTVNYVVSPLSTTSILFAGSKNSTEYGEPLILIANVTGSVSNPPLPPGGTVTFFDGVTNIGTGTLSALSGNTSTATITVTSLTIGTHILSATYSADTNYTSSTTPNLSHEVIRTNTTSVVTTSGTPSVIGQNVTFTATVSTNSPGMGNPTGNVSFYNGTMLLGTGVLSPTIPNTSQATFSVSSLSLGSHTIFVTYPETTNFTSSTSAAITQVVNQDSTTTVLTSSSPTSNFGDLVTYSATVTANPPGSGTPTGSVNFFEGSTLLGTGTLNGSGVATFATNFLYPGTHALTAKYLGDTNYTLSSSAVFTQTVVNKLDTTTTVTSSRNSSPINQSVTYSAQVTSIPVIPASAGSFIPTGIVSFYDGPTLIGTGTLNAAGIATVVQSGVNLNTAPTTHPITAVYSSDANFNTSTSAIYNEYIVPYDTAVLLTSTPNHSERDNVTFTATVTASGLPLPIPVFTGTVTFFDGSSAISSPIPVPANGIVTFQPACLQFDGRSIRAVYSGDQTQFATATSNVINQQVQQTDMVVTNTVVATSQSNTYFCQPVTLSATVTAPGCDTPTGTVTFFDTNVSIGTAVLNSSGLASLPISTLAIGTHTITATYNSDSNYAFSSSSNQITQTVSPNPTTTTLSLIPSISNTPYGQNLLFVATVTAPYSVPAGQVIFSEDDVTLAEVILDSNGVASFNTTILSGGSHTIKATYQSGCCSLSTGCFLASSTTLAHNISRVNPMLSLSANPSPSVYGNNVRLTATVAAYGNGTPTGSVSFYQGSTFLGTSQIIQGVANLNVSNVPAGLILFNAVYSGDQSFLQTSFPSYLQTVNKANVIVSLTSSSPNPTEYGQTVALRAEVISPISIPTGTLSFFWGSTLLSTVPLDPSGAAILSTAAIPIGANNLTAVYNGSSNFNTATSPIFTQNVVKSSTITTIVNSSPKPSTFNSPVTFTVSVAPEFSGGATPTGTITGFFGSTNLGTATLTGGTATFVTSVLPVGTDTITVVYNGDSNYLTSTGLGTHTVNLATTTVSTLTSSNPTSVYGQPVTFSATVTSSAGVPTGSVTFFDGTTQIGIGTLNSSGMTAITTSSLSVATHTIRAVYSGSSSFAAVTSSNLTQIVNKAATSTALTSNIGTAVFGQPVTFTATLSPTSPGAGFPTGTISFKNGATTLGTVTLNNGGIVSFTTSSLPASGTPYNITAVYNGDANFLTSTSPILPQAVNSVSTLITAVSSINPSSLGQNVTFTATVTAINTGTVTPIGTVTATYGSTVIGTGSLNASGSISFTTSTLPAGTLPIIFNYAGSANFSASTATLDQTVQSAATTTTLVSSLTPSYVGQSINLTATVTSLTGSPTGTISFFDGSALIGTQTLISGTAVLSVSNLTLGSHLLTAVYNGDASHVNSISTPITQVVQQATTATALTSSVNPTQFGQATLLTATVSVTNGAGNPSGTVSFFDGATLLGTRGLNGGIATLTTSSLATGTHNLTAIYSGDTNFSGSTSPAVSQVVSLATTTTSVASSNNPSTLGSSVSFTATVQIPVGSGAPTGTVTFRDGATVIGTVSLVGLQATFTTTTLTLGSHTITATYNGNSNYTSSTSSGLPQVVNQGSSSITLTSTLNPSEFGQSINLVATLPTLSGMPVATGMVSYYDGPLLLGTASLNGLGIATFPISTLSVASHTLTAVYGGDVNYTASTSPIYVQLVTSVNTFTTVSSSLNPSAYGNLVTFTSNVTATAGSAIPTGLVSFREGATILGSSPLISGVATFSTTDLSAGNHLISAIYLGNSNFNTSTSATLTQVVQLSGVSVGLSSSINPSTLGQQITLSAALGLGLGLPLPPTGTVTFKEGSTILGTSVLSVGVATLNISDLSVGLHLLTATYNGDDNYNSATSLPYLQIVDKAATITNILAATSNPSMLGQAVTFFVDVSSPAGSPTGTVSYFDGATLIGTSSVFNGLSVFETNLLAVGNHPITAEYGGDANFLPSGSAPPVTQTVVQNFITVTSVTTITSNNNPSNFGEAVTFDVTVTPLTGPGTPTGVVTLYSGSYPLVTLNLVGGMASFTTSDIPAGTWTIVALYSGDSTFSSSTGTIAQQVLPISTTTTIASSSIISSVFQPVTFTAQVTAASGILTGTVSFYDGITLLGTMPLNGSGLAALTNADLSVGTHTISAVYNASQNFQGSSASLTQTVNAAATNTMILLSSPNPSAFGESVNFVATVSSAIGVPTGSVNFYAGSTLIGSGTLANGIAVISTSSLPVGSNAITAYYVGSTNFEPSTSLPYTQIVNAPLANTSVSLSSSKNPAQFGDTVAFSAQVTASSGTPTGTVTFYDGTTALGTALLVNGTAVLEVSDLAIGNHPIKATYNGDANYNPSSSSTLLQVITASKVPPSPDNFFGCQVKNEYLNANQYVNVLTWTPPQSRVKIIGYEIYRDARLKRLVASVKNQCPYRYEDVLRDNRKARTYYIVSVSAKGVKSAPVKARIEPRRSNDFE